MATSRFIILLLAFCADVALAFVTGASCGVSHGKGKLSTFKRILGGASSYLGQWPWQVIVEQNGEFGCSGVLINPKWILTVAHCLDTGVVSKRQPNYTVVTGEHDLRKAEETEIRQNVSRIVRHPDYNRITGENDIALVELSGVVQLTQMVSLVCLPRAGQDFSGRQCVVTGWGNTHYTGNPDVLQWVSVPVIGQKDCQRQYPKNSHYHIFPTNICAGTRHKDSCGGDSGGPLVCWTNHRWVLAGLVSWGEGCGTPHPGVYTRVSSYIKWIQQTLNK